MDRHSDLPLFRWTPPPVEVIPFPCRHRVGKIRRTAELMLTSTDKAGVAHWRRTITDLRRQMDRAGISEDRVEHELRSFFDAVQAEMNRVGRLSSKPEGGAA